MLEKPGDTTEDFQQPGQCENSLMSKLSKQVTLGCSRSEASGAWLGETREKPSSGT